MRHWGQLHETGGHCVRHWPSWPAPPYWAAYHLPCWSGRGGQVEDVAFLSSLKGNPKSSDVCQLGWWVTRDQHRFHLLLHVIEVDGSCGPSHPWRPFRSRRLSYCASIVDNSGQHPALSLSAFIFSRLLVIDCGILVVKIHDLPSLLSIHMRQAPKPAPAPYLIGEITNGKNSNDQREREPAHLCTHVLLYRTIRICIVRPLLLAQP